MLNFKTIKVEILVITFHNISYKNTLSSINVKKTFVQDTLLTFIIKIYNVIKISLDFVLYLLYINYMCSFLQFYNVIKDHIMPLEPNNTNNELSNPQTSGKKTEGIVIIEGKPGDTSYRLQPNEAQPDYNSSNEFNKTKKRKSEFLFPILSISTGIAITVGTVIAAVAGMIVKKMFEKHHIKFSDGLFSVAIISVAALAGVAGFFAAKKHQENKLFTENKMSNKTSQATSLQ